MSKRYQLSRELVWALRILRDVLAGDKTREELKDLLTTEDARDYFQGFSLVSLAMNGADAIVAGSLCDEKRRPIPYGSWHEYGYAVFSFYAKVPAEAVVIKDIVATGRGLEIIAVRPPETKPQESIFLDSDLSKTIVLIEREFRYAIANAFLPVKVLKIDLSNQNQDSDGSPPNDSVNVNAAKHANEHPDESYKKVMERFGIKGSVRTWKRNAENEGAVFNPRESGNKTKKRIRQ